jgi:hypothetical protein
MRDCFRFATFDAGCSLQVALGVKRKWKQDKHDGKHYSGQPKMANMHEIHDLMPRVRRLRDSRL